MPRTAEPLLTGTILEGLACRGYSLQAFAADGSFLTSGNEKSQGTRVRKLAQAAWTDGSFRRHASCARRNWLGRSAPDSQPR